MLLNKKCFICFSFFFFFLFLCNFFALFICCLILVSVHNMWRFFINFYVHYPFHNSAQPRLKLTALLALMVRWCLFSWLAIAILSIDYCRGQYFLRDKYVLLQRSSKLLIVVFQSMLLFSVVYSSKKRKKVEVNRFPIRFENFLIFWLHFNL